MLYCSLFGGGFFRPIGKDAAAVILAVQVMFLGKLDRTEVAVLLLKSFGSHFTPYFAERLCPSSLSQTEFLCGLTERVEQNQPNPRSFAVRAVYSSRNL